MDNKDTICIILVVLLLGLVCCHVYTIYNLNKDIQIWKDDYKLKYHAEFQGIPISEIPMLTKKETILITPYEQLALGETSGPMPLPAQTLDKYGFIQTCEYINNWCLI